MKRRAKEIHVEIGELVLEGLAGMDRYAVAKAVQRELGRLMADGGFAPERGYSMDVADGGAVKWQGSRAEAAGNAIAGVVARGVKGE